MTESTGSTSVTRCPNCDTSFRVTDAQLQAANGAVRCGACLQVFDATVHMVADGPAQKPDTGTAESGSAMEPGTYAEVSGESDVVDTESPWDRQELTAPETTGESWEGREEREAFGEGEQEEYGERQAYEDRETHEEREAHQEWEARAGEDAGASIASKESQQPEGRESREAPVTDADAIPDEGVLPEGPDSSESEAARTGSEAFDADGEDGRELPDEVDVQASDEAAGDIEGGAGRPILLDEEFDSRDFSGDIEVGADDPAEIVGEEVHAGARRRVLGWFMGSLFLVLTGGLQLAWFNKDEWSKDEQWRPFYESLCNVIGCTVEPFEDKGALAITNLIIRSHPVVERALVVDALLVNRADFRQAFPDIELRFSTMAGELVAARVFSPADYLRGELTGLRYIPAATEVRLSLEIVDPGDEATNYTLDVK